MNVRLRPFDATDAPAVVSWVTDDRELRWLAPKSPPPFTANCVVAWRNRLNRQFILVLPSDEPVGYAEVSRSRGEVTHSWLGHILVAPQYRGRGVGTAFVRILLATAFEDTHVQRVSLVVFPDNYAAIACYQRCGFLFTRDEWHRFHPNGDKFRMKRFDLNRSAWMAESRSIVNEATTGNA